MSNTAPHCRLCIFQDSDFAGDFEKFKNNFVKNLMYFRKSNICLFKLAVQDANVCVSQFHGIAIYFVGCGFEKGRVSVLVLLDVVMEVLQKIINQGAAGDSLHKLKTKVTKKGNQNVDQLRNLDHVATNASSLQGESPLYIFDDNEVVIQIIVKGRSPTIGHVSRTRRVALDSLFDKINLDLKIQIKIVDTKNQLANMLTKGSFTGD